MKPQSTELHLKLDLFIRKFYRNRIIRGSLIMLIASLLLLFILFVFDFSLNFPLFIRPSIFWLYIVVCTLISVIYIIIPLLKLFRVVPRMTYLEAANLIGSAFQGVSDKIITVLELELMSQNNINSSALVLASIDQGISKLKPIPFPEAINYATSLRFIKHLLLIIILYSISYFLFPRFLKESGVRFIHYDSTFTTRVGFDFLVLNDSLKLIKGNDFKIKVKAVGEVYPSEMYINYGANSFRMNQESKNVFSYDFNNINNDLKIYFSAGQQLSKNYLIQVVPSPLILSFEVSVTPPSYISTATETFQNIGDITVPFGASVKWSFSTSDAKQIALIFKDIPKSFLLSESNVFSFNFVPAKSSQYVISLSNTFINVPDFVNYTLTVIPDLFPEISVSEQSDSLITSTKFFGGNLKDDYGFSKLNFCYSYHDGQSLRTEVIGIPFNKQLALQRFDFNFDFSQFLNNDISKIDYYFEVWDNDAIHGFKSMKSKAYTYIIPSIADINKQKEESFNNLKSDLKQSQDLLKDLSKSLSKLQQNSLNNSSQRQQEQLLNSLMNQKNELQKILDKIQQQQLSKQNPESLTDEQRELLEKQKMIEDLMKNIFTEDMKALMEEISKLQNDLSKEQINEISKRTNIPYKDLSKELDRNLKLLKKLEVEQKLSDVISNLENLSIKQDNLSDNVLQKSFTQDILLEKQQAHENDLKELDEEFKKALELNQQLESPMSLNSLDNDFDKIKKNMEETLKDIQNGNRKSASKQQKSNSKQLKDLAAKLNKMMEESEGIEMEQNEEDLRQLLNNLVSFSFGQEALMNKTLVTLTGDPSYVTNSVTQHNLVENFSQIEDSLRLLASKVPQIGTPVNKELSAIANNFIDIITSLESRSNQAAAMRQQLVITSVNNLSLYLSEILQQMKNPKSGSGSGSKKSKKKSQGEPSLSDIKQMQEKMKGDMEDMLNQMKSGKMDKKGQSQKLSQMLGQQEIMSQMLNELSNSKGIGGQMQKQINEIKEMLDKNQRDIINRTISPTTIARQSEIKTKLLEVEKADREQDQEERREAERVKNPKLSNPSTIFSYTDIHKSFKEEELNKSSSKLNNYYRRKYLNYLSKFKLEAQ